ncbi:MAG: pyridoxal-phosphate dependent enzyme [Gammaproteobacteria bacterium]|nr:pyridoxal-phosphate dependent enzyme [Gammaproteobacteria bacterium]
MLMKGALENVLDAIGDTPIIKLQSVASHVDSEIYVKLEAMNPGGSVKERIGKYILEKAIERGELKPGGTIIEGTSGNTGVGLAMFAAVHGYKCIFVLADKQSKEKIDNLRAFGAKVIVCPTNVPAEDPKSYYSVSAGLAKTIPNSYFVSQYDNPFNAETHYYTTAPEIYAQTGGEFDAFVAGVGTGGTISGCGKYFKEKMPEVRIVGVDIEGSILAHYHKTGEVCEAKPYVLEGIGEDILPDNVHFDIIDEFVMTADKESFLMTRKLLTDEGLYVGGSCGAAVVGAIRYAEGLKTPQRILTLLPDSGNRYASKIFNDDWMRDNGYLDSSFNVMIKDVLETLGKGQEKLQTIDDTATVREAIAALKKYSISQLPVYHADALVGVVSENQLLRPVFEGDLDLGETISVALQNNYRVIDANHMLNEVTDALLREDIVIVTAGDDIVDILTNSDILNFVSQKQTYGKRRAARS